jgi:hypothetical protein
MLGEEPASTPERRRRSRALRQYDRPHRSDLHNLVVTYRPDDIAPDVKTQARAVLQYVFDRLAKRWTQEQRDLPPLALSANT